MQGVIAEVDRRTRLVGHNRLELLMFRLAGTQPFGINVFKVREVLRCPALTRLPGSHPAVCGIVHLRGLTITVFDLSLAIGAGATSREDAHIVVTEFNRQVQGFLVHAVDRIVNLDWASIVAPPDVSGEGSYVTAVTRVDDELVQIIDVEKVLAEVTGTREAVSARLVAASPAPGARRVFVVDDSVVARRQITRTLEQIGLQHEVAGNGREALDRLLELAATLDTRVSEHFVAIVSDVEMPEMDGYTLCGRVKADPRLNDLWFCLHSSLSGVFNQSLVRKVGADRFVAKFHPDELGGCLLERVREAEAAAVMARSA